MPGSNRLARLEPPVEVAGICPTCHKAVTRKKMVGQMQTEGFYRNGDYYHYNCIPQSEHDWRGRREVTLIPRGNLESEEYRIWIGSKETYTTYAMCRCCRTSVYSTLDRQLHIKNEKFAVGGDRCSTRLVKAYKAMLDLSICVICKKQRFSNEKWGVPLCDRPECETEWKFGQNKYMALEYQLLQQVKKAEFMEREKKGEPNFVVTKEDGTTIYRPWCKTCVMFSDNAAHSEVHAAAIIEGKIKGD